MSLYGYLLFNRNFFRILFLVNLSLECSDSFTQQKGKRFNCLVRAWHRVQRFINSHSHKKADWRSLVLFYMYVEKKHVETRNPTYLQSTFLKRKKKIRQNSPSLTDKISSLFLHHSIIEEQNPLMMR